MWEVVFSVPTWRHVMSSGTSQAPKRGNSGRLCANRQGDRQPTRRHGRVPFWVCVRVGGQPGEQTVEPPAVGSATGSCCSGTNRREGGTGAWRWRWTNREAQRNDTVDTPPARCMMPAAEHICRWTHAHARERKEHRRLENYCIDCTVFCIVLSAATA